jgi:hypothetical protein
MALAKAVHPPAVLIDLHAASRTLWDERVTAWWCEARHDISWLGRNWGPWEKRLSEFRDRYPIASSGIVRLTLAIGALVFTAISAYVAGTRHALDGQAAKTTITVPRR